MPQTPATVFGYRSYASACYLVDNKHINVKQATGETLIGRFSRKQQVK